MAEQMHVILWGSVPPAAPSLTSVWIGAHPHTQGGSQAEYWNQQTRFAKFHSFQAIAQFSFFSPIPDWTEALRYYQGRFWKSPWVSLEAASQDSLDAVLGMSPELSPCSEPLSKLISFQIILHVTWQRVLQSLTA